MGGAVQVTIAGAGVLGLTCALALADAGCQVSVCDPAPPGQNASGVAAGMLAPAFEAVLDESARPHFDLLLYARDLWPLLAQRAGVILERTGSMAVGSDAWLGELAGRFTALGLHPTELPAAAVGDLAPELTDRFEHAFLVREDWRLEPLVALRALRHSAEAAGVTFGQSAVSTPEAGEFLVVATGASRSLTGLVPELAGLSPIKGHILRFKVPWANPGVTVRAENAYAVPGEGLIRVGSTMEPGRADDTVDPAKTERLYTAAARLFPGLAEAQFEAFTGIRAATLDGLPLAGPSTAPGVFLAVGARRNGWLLAPLVAQAIAARITGKDLDRFALRLDPARA